MIRDVAVRSFEEVLREIGLPYTYRSNDHVLRVADTFDILFRSGERPELLVGSNAGWAIIDEPAQQSEEVPKAILSRVRDPKAKQRQTVMTGTPEGFNWFYEWCSKPGTEVIRAKTMDNPFMGSNYASMLSERFTPEEVQAYLHGEFVNFDGAWFRVKPVVKPSLVAEDLPGVEIFLLPGQTSGQLVIGIDTGGGLDKDASAIAMVDKRDDRLVACWKDNKAAIDTICDITAQLVERYTAKIPAEFPGLYGERRENKPQCVVEVNGIGRGTYQGLQRRGIGAIEVNTTESSRYSGLLAVRRAIENGKLEGPQDLAEEARALVTKDGKFHGPKDLAMAIGFAYNWIQKSPYLEPKTEHDKRRLDMTARLKQVNGVW